MPSRFYDSPEWRRFRDAVIARDAERCTVGRLLGGDCHPVLHVHHLIPVADGGAPLDEANAITACARHHPALEALRRSLVRGRSRDSIPRCRHRHPYPGGRAECEARMARRAAA